MGCRRGVASLLWALGAAIVAPARAETPDRGDADTPTVTVQLRGHRSLGATWTLAPLAPPPAPPSPADEEFERYVEAHAPPCRGSGCPRPNRSPSVDVDPSPVAVCPARGCTAELPVGRYRLAVSGPPGAGIARSARELDVGTDLVIDARAPRRAGKWGGLAAGITGSALYATGAWLLLNWPLMSFQQCPLEGCSGPSQAAVLHAGLITGLSGLVLAPIGWVMFVRNVQLRYDVYPSAPLELPPGLSGAARLAPRHGLCVTASF